MSEEQKKLEELLAAHARKEDDIDLENLLALLPAVKVWVPGIDARTKDTYAAIHEENLLKKLDMPVLPDLLKTEDGRSFYPVFTSKAQAPEDYRNFFEWVEIDFLEMCYFAAHSEITSEIILDPFSFSLILPVTLVLQYSDRFQTEHEQMN